MEGEGRYLREFDDVLGLEGHVLHTLIGTGGKELTKQELAKTADVSLTFLNGYYPKLEKHGLITETRRIGKAKLFQINMDNDIVKKLHEIIVSQLEKEEIRRAKLLYAKHYKGKEDDVELALLELLQDQNAKLAPKVDRELEKRGFILTKDGVRYFTQRGYEVASAIKEFNKDVLGKD